MTSSQKLEILIRSSGNTVHSFASKAKYSPTQLYKLCKGERDIMSMSVANFVIFARLLGFSSFEEFARSLQLDLLDDLVQNGGMDK